ncbi:NAD(P)-dependent oxidoreductase [Polynucleobacter sp. AP-Feld-500C-C5]|uniref:NAD-dependent epimerase/dehydratase family protein n=1 Tax=Polynucleobacter sp. AP-Feld-500C-C5 TaxID=2576924 RepID=UPI001C0ACCB6|nr:NAD(P)-dependent oxidoreductase [Polynucleobacter sp. AP-Feld-500C-C5]MBU3632868.1 NAD(P)-dependent oxidoreductase [Polynucleobacter sp. AP-Feld-500C-C5]
MLIENNPADMYLERVVVLGASGFIGGEIVSQLNEKKIPVVSIGKKNIDLLDDNASDLLFELLTPSDTLIFTSALAPCKNLIMLQDNLRMVSAVCKALQKCSLAHVIYISSDAVYKDSSTPITETSCAEPSSLHGVMHLAREIALKQHFSGPLTVIRPTLVYGLKDPHNGYGPNKFRRLAANGESITLFGNGEELRDHVYVGDIAELICRAVFTRMAGTFNAVSGDAVTFHQLAHFIAAEHSLAAPVICTERVGDMPHGGYRIFDNSAVIKAFPDFKFKTWREGMSLVSGK